MPDRPVIDAESAARLRGVVVRLSRQFNQFSTLEGLTPSQASALGVISHRGPIGLADVARIEGLNPTMVSRIVGHLDELGLIRRMPHPDDSRAGVVEATDAGRAMSARIGAERAALVADCLDGMQPADRELILAALPALEALEKRFLERGRP